MLERYTRYAPYAVTALVILFVGYLYLFTRTSIVTISTLLFSGMLAILYSFQSRTMQKQTQIMNSQQKLMEKQHEPELVFCLEYYNPLYVDFVIKNVGESAALDVNLDYEFDGEEKSWSKSLIEPDESHVFFTRTKGNSHMTVDQLKENLEDSLLKYEISCNSILGDYCEFNGSFDIIESIEGRESDEIFRETGVESINDNLSDLVSEVKDIRKKLD